jgi:acyl-CoA synthetase (NDP forming)
MSTATQHRAEGGRTAKPRVSIERILNPRSVAVIGASEDVSKFGGRIIYYLTRHHFPGTIVPVNPARATIRGLPAYKSIGDAPVVVDVAILAVPPDSLIAACRACADAGVGCCVVMTTGFAEIGPVGRARQDELEVLSRESGMRVVGPNCMGMIVPTSAMALTSSLVLEHGELAAGRIGLISQSGALMVSIYDRARAAGLGFSACTSLGNQSDVEICDFLEFMIDDTATDAICLYVEGFRDPHRFLTLAARARARGKPLLMVKSGRTEAGVRAAMSHTASLAGAYDVLASACEERGVLLLDDPDDMIRAADALLRFGTPNGDGVGVLSPSGGGGATGIDRVVERRLRPADLDEATRSGLTPFLLPSFRNNPIDLGGRTVALAGSAAVETLVRTFAAAPDIGALCVLLTTVPDFTETARAIGSGLLASRKPFVLAVTPGPSADGPRAALREIGCPYFDSVDSALRVLGTLMEARRLTALPVPVAVARPPGLPAAASLSSLPGGQLTELEVKSLARSYGVPTCEERLCVDIEAAVAAAGTIGYPVALKPVCRDLIHKSDIGAVKLNLRDEAALRSAWRDVMGAVGQALPGAAIEGGLVLKMASGVIEVIFGARNDPQFGPVLLLGAGGTTVELDKDVVLALAPVSADTARRLFGKLRIAPLLDGWRGRAPLDLAALADAASRFSILAQDLGERLIEMELNPVLVGEKGAGVTAVDGRATLI